MGLLGLGAGFAAKAAFWLNGMTVPEFRYMAKLRERRSRQELSSQDWVRWRRKIKEPMEDEIFERDQHIRKLKNEQSNLMIEKTFFEPEPPKSDAMK
jgi:hypothetical protein